jgi:hypothetical protein
MHDGCMLSVGACMFALLSASLVLKLEALASCRLRSSVWSLRRDRIQVPAFCAGARCMTCLRPFLRLLAAGV